MGKQWKQCQTLFFGAPKSLQMVIAPMKLKGTYSLEEKLSSLQRTPVAPGPLWVGQASRASVQAAAGAQTGNILTHSPGHSLLPIRPLPSSLLPLLTLFQDPLKTVFSLNPWDFPGGRVLKNLPANAGDMGSIPGSLKHPSKVGRSHLGQSEK